MSNLAEDLAALGLTRNEALAYVCLLQAEEPLGLTGYEVAARSGIPRSAVYGILRRLQEGEFAFPTGDKPARYAPLPPREVVARVRSQTLERIEDLAGRLEELPARNQPEPIWILDRYERLLQVVSERLAAAERTVYLSVWQRELGPLAGELEAAVARGVAVVLHSLDPGLVCPEGASCWVDRTADAARQRWAHKLVVVVDATEAILGGAEPGAGNQAVHTRNPSLVDLATNHVILDITLTAHRLGRDASEVVAPMMRPHRAK